MTCNFLWMCQGYYKHQEGYTRTSPEWPDFKGDIVHPQNWPADLDYTGKKGRGDRLPARPPRH